MFMLRFLTSFLVILFIEILSNDNLITVNKNLCLSSSTEQAKQSQIYDIESLVQNLYLQRCAFVEIGEGFCALFVELRDEVKKSARDTNVLELFLGICDCGTLRTWKLCSSELYGMRKSDCIFTEATVVSNTSARVHRRLCDITLLGLFAPACNCSLPLAGQELLRIGGFPTCFLYPLPRSICSPRGVCGVARCFTKTIMGIHSVECDPDCHYGQPFCEDPERWTTIPTLITSFWSKWSNPRCNVNCGIGSLVSTAFCYNQITKQSAIDCIGPGFSCCSGILGACSCKVIIENGIMRVDRFTDNCVNYNSCLDMEKRERDASDGDFLIKDYGRDDDYKGITGDHIENEISSEMSEDYGQIKIGLPSRFSRSVYFDKNNDDVVDMDDDYEGMREVNWKREREIGIEDNVDEKVIEYDPDMDSTESEIEEREEKNFQSEDEADDEEEEDENGEEEEEEDVIPYKLPKRVLRSDEEAVYKRRRKSGKWKRSRLPFKRKKAMPQSRICKDFSAREPLIYYDYDPNEEVNSSSGLINNFWTIILILILVIGYSFPDLTSSFEEWFTEEIEN